MAVAGLGLMGGSLALALRPHCRALLGIDTDGATLALAHERGLPDISGSLRAALGYDLLVLATPVRTILAQLGELAQLSPPRRLVVLDLGSTKAEITRAMRALPAGYDPIGGHPMCGKEVSGLAHADAGLFQDKVFVLTPLERTSPGAAALARAVVLAAGARPWLLLPEQHDALAALSSHLPYLAAALLVRAAEAGGDERVWTMAASGFRDTSRLAASDVTMMLDILLTNRAAVLTALAGYHAELQHLTACLEAGDETGLRALLEAARARRQGLFT